MRVFTSSWFTKLPAGMLRIGISRSVPRGQPPGYRRIKELEPGPWFNSVTPEKYHDLFMAHLATLDARTIFGTILAMGREARAPDVALLCYEAPSDPEAWCHRGQVSAWFKDELGEDVLEYGLDGSGWSHPKLFKGVRR